MKALFLSVLSSLFLTSAVFASGSEGELFTKHFNHQNGVAVHGYDVVSFFNGTPAKGHEDYEVDLNDVVFQFANQQNADAFSADPEKYLPAYGGWCATAMGMMGKKLDVNPVSYVIQSGVLYLFSTSMGPAKEDWIKNQPDLKAKADANWTLISSH